MPSLRSSVDAVPELCEEEAMAEGYQNKRVERSKAAVLEETYRQLTKGGLGGVSIDDVSRASGVAKTTIYRHWPSRSALLVDACSRMGGAQPAPSLGSLGDDLSALCRNVAEQLRTAAWTGVLPSIIDAAERDEEIAAMHSAMHHGNVAPFHAAVGAARERGEVSSDTTSADLVAMTLGPLFYRRWFSKEPIDDRFVDAVVAAAVGAAAGDRPDEDGRPRGRPRPRRSS